jgi:hypothetical protein
MSYLNLFIFRSNGVFFQALSLIFTFGNENGNTADDPYAWLLERMPTLPYFDAVLGSLTFALRKVCVVNSAQGCYKKYCLKGLSEFSAFALLYVLGVLRRAKF